MLCINRSWNTLCLEPVAMERGDLHMYGGVCCHQAHFGFYIGFTILICLYLLFLFLVCYRGANPANTCTCPISSHNASTAAITKTERGRRWRSGGHFHEHSPPVYPPPPALPKSVKTQEMWWSEESSCLLLESFDLSGLPKNNTTCFFLFSFCCNSL